MKLGKRQVPDIPTEAEITERLGGPELVHNRGLLADWYIRLRLGQELERCKRYEHALSLVMLATHVLPGEDFPALAVYAAAAVAKKIARETDLLGWLDKHSILIIMPDTDGAGAEVAAQRWRNEMWMHRAALGIVSWKTAVLQDIAKYTNAEEALAAALAELAQAR